MHRSFIVPEGPKAKTAFVVFLTFKKTYFPAASVSICSTGGAVLFAGTSVCLFRRDYDLSIPEFPNVV